MRDILHILYIGAFFQGLFLLPPLVAPTISGGYFFERDRKMNEIEEIIAEAIRSTQDRKRDLIVMLGKRALRYGKTVLLKKIAIQDFILQALREKQERERNEDGRAGRKRK